MNIQERPPSPTGGVPARSEQLQPASASGGDSIREADSARSGAGGDNEPKKGPDGISSASTRGLSDYDRADGGGRGVFIDSDGDFRADDRRRAAR